MEKYKVAVIGSGPGGYVAAIRAAQLGAKTAIIEDKFMGGVCLNEGCIPTKALLRSAEVLHTLKTASDFGFEIEGTIRTDWGKVLSRKEKVTKTLTSGISSLLKKNGVTVYKGRGLIEKEGVVAITGNDKTSTRIEAEKIIIATGSRTAIPAIPGIDLPSVMDSTRALQVDSLPDRLAIIGGGVIGVEFASIFSAFGVKVTIIEMCDSLLPMMDRELGKELEKTYRKKGVEVLLSHNVLEVEENRDSLQLKVSAGNEVKKIVVDKVLVAVGRKANMENIGIENIGIECHRKGIQVNDHMKTSSENVYAIGDVTGDWWLAHVASHQGIVAAENACDRNSAMEYNSVPSCVFTFPEIASVGMTEEKARERYGEVSVGKFPFSANGKALTYGESTGWVKIVSDPQTGEILGTHIIGPHASDLILEAGLAISLEATPEEIAHTIHSHPSLGEAVMEASLSVLGRAIHF